ncbi:uncharacterized protein HMPREF1541_10149 [Cyphellophora europaea CBS 101466]|uniref:Chromo domain-containing protein n=1 Tax=Cyphellophora europaea (strain CBS 101466) TaxID=1220924 RepID=W2S9A2_CYPE1|nr:uncharacterized protein HMPREF1541_10149 [Cyphellophora europaea CBS 101466]ETN44479.1 hypothetical protein HMPREF1541_10149 [Cyphellophora europaea CBS 101466]
MKFRYGFPRHPCGYHYRSVDASSDTSLDAHLPNLPIPRRAAAPEPEPWQMFYRSIASPWPEKWWHPYEKRWRPWVSFSRGARGSSPPPPRPRIGEVDAEHLALWRKVEVDGKRLLKQKFAARDVPWEEQRNLQDPKFHTGEGMWPVRRIIDQRNDGEDREYLVEWEHHPVTREKWMPTWVHASGVGTSLIRPWRHACRDLWYKIHSQGDVRDDYRDPEGA